MDKTDSTESAEQEGGSNLFFNTTSVQINTPVLLAINSLNQGRLTIIHSIKFSMIQSFVSFSILAFMLGGWGIKPNIDFQKTSNSKLASVGEIPILAWHSIPAEETNVERFREMKEAGITHSFSGYPNADAVQKALDVAQQTGIKLIISCPEMATAPEATVKRFMKHPALAGYYLRDEPSADEFADLGVWAKKIQAVDKEHFCYLNLFPTYASLDQLKATSYRNHVQRFIKEVPTQILSYDHYPIIVEKEGLKLRDDYYENLEICSSEARKAGKPFWAFALAVAHDPYPIPDLAQLRVQMFSNLAYGAQGLQYFTYWTPGKNPHWNFHHGPIGLDGKRTDVYDKVKALNQEIKALTPIFLGGKVVKVSHTGGHTPTGAQAFTTLPGKVTRLEIKGSGNDAKQTGALISEIQNGSHRYLVIVNKDFQKQLMLEISLDNGVKRVMKDGSLVSAALYTPSQFIDPGDMHIYQLE